MKAAALANDLAEQVREQLLEERRAHTAEKAELWHAIAELQKTLGALPAGRDGQDGIPGPAGAPGDRGEKGEAGTSGVDGQPGKDGRDGRDGKDGIASLDEIKAIAFKAVDDRLEAEVQKRVAEVVGALPTLQYRDVYQAGTEYRAGDCVSWGGQLYIAAEPTTAKPGDGKAWSLAVKRGRDGKDLR